MSPNKFCMHKGRRFAPGIHFVWQRKWPAMPCPREPPRLVLVREMNQVPRVQAAKLRRFGRFCSSKLCLFPFSSRGTVHFFHRLWSIRQSPIKTSAMYVPTNHFSDVVDCRLEAIHPKEDGLATLIFWSHDLGVAP
jgi:hypothetical protein